jgi:hypothetical protein
MLILSIVLLVALYYLYKFLLGAANGTNVIKISEMPNTPVYDKKENDNPGSYRYSYAIWVRANNLGNNMETNKFADENSSNNIMYSTNTTNSTEYFTFSLDLYGDTSLYVRYGSGTLGDRQVALSKAYLVTPNFPLQKWTLLIVSFDNKVMDLYLDGKLIKSANMEKLPLAQNTTATMKFGKGDMEVYNYTRFSYPMDPQTAWTLYLQGRPPTTSVNSYGLNLNIKQNNLPLSYIGKVQLF